MGVPRGCTGEREPRALSTHAVLSPEGGRTGAHELHTRTLDCLPGRLRNEVPSAQVVEDAVGDIAHRELENVREVAAGRVVGRGEKVHAVLV